MGMRLGNSSSGMQMAAHFVSEGKQCVSQGNGSLHVTGLELSGLLVALDSTPLMSWREVFER